jgi:hypothetical protein
MELAAPVRPLVPEIISNGSRASILRTCVTTQSIDWGAGAIANESEAARGARHLAGKLIVP